MSNVSVSDIRTRYFFTIVPLRSQIKLFVAIFSTFAAIGFLYDLAAAGPPRPWHHVAGWVIVSGLVSMGYAFAFMHDLKWLWLVVPAAFLLFWWVRPPLRYEPRAAVSAGACLVMIVAGYIFFVSFIRSEAIRGLRLQTEMMLAQQIHTNLIPPVTLATPTVEVFGRSVPSSEMGGDLLDLSEQDGGLSVFVADVSGHGVGAGVLMGMVKSAIRMKLRSSSELSGLLNDLNAITYDLTTPEMFVTFAGLRVKSDRVVEFAIAGHPPILHYHARDRNVTHLETEQLPLGVIPGEVYENRPVEVAPGDVLVLFTDGFMEVFDRDGAQFGIERLSYEVAENAQRPLEEVYAAVNGAVTAFGPQSDDQTLCLVRIRSTVNSDVAVDKKTRAAVNFLP